MTTPATIEPLALRVLAAATAAEARVATVMAAAVSSSVGVVQVVVPEGDSNRRCSACLQIDSSIDGEFSSTAVSLDVSSRHFNCHIIGSA